MQSFFPRCILYVCMHLWICISMNVCERACAVSASAIWTSNLSCGIFAEMRIHLTGWANYSLKKLKAKITVSSSDVFFQCVRVSVHYKRCPPPPPFLTPLKKLLLSCTVAISLCYTVHVETESIKGCQKKVRPLTHTLECVRWKRSAGKESNSLEHTEKIQLCGWKTMCDQRKVFLQRRVHTAACGEMLPYFIQYSLGS